MTDIITLSPDTADSLDVLIAQIKDGKFKRNPLAIFTGQATAIVNVNATADEDNNVYLGTVQMLQSDDLTWSDAELDIFVMGANGEKLTIDSNYLALGYGAYTYDGNEYQLFVCSLGSSGDDAFSLTVNECTDIDDLEIEYPLTVSCTDTTATIEVDSVSITYLTGGTVTTTVTTTVAPGTATTVCNGDGTFTTTFGAFTASSSAISTFTSTTATANVLPA